MADILLPIMVLVEVQMPRPVMWVYMVILLPIYIQRVLQAQQMALLLTPQLAVVAFPEQVQMLEL